MQGGKRSKGKKLDSITSPGFRGQKTKDRGQKTEDSSISGGFAATRYNRRDAPLRSFPNLRELFLLQAHSSLEKAANGYHYKRCVESLLSYRIVRFQRTEDRRPMTVIFPAAKPPQDDCPQSSEPKSQKKL
jgi:hypothetical protein